MPKICQSKFATVTASLIQVGELAGPAQTDPRTDELFAQKGEARPSGAHGRVVDLPRTAKQGWRVRSVEQAERPVCADTASSPNGAATEVLTMAKAARALCNELRAAVSATAGAR